MPFPSPAPKSANPQHSTPTLEKLFGSKTKTDILKYLLFKRQGISMRALENELDRTFPAIKKQIAVLDAAQIITIDADRNKRSIFIRDERVEPLRSIFRLNLQLQILKLFASHADQLDSCFFGRVFGAATDRDLIVLHHDLPAADLEKLKKSLEEIFKKFFIDSIATRFPSADERAKRERLGDKFVMEIKKANCPQHKIEK